MNTQEIRMQGLDKFYTNPDIVDICIENVEKLYPFNKFDLIIEPSAGNGSFLHKIQSDKKIGLDIEPEHSDIIKQNFFDYLPDTHHNKHVLVIGNPPFGKNSSLAINFFNHASIFADIIAFIIPKTFRRISVHNKLNKYFHLVFDENIPTNPCSFTPKMMVKCCFQIWEKKSNERPFIKLALTHDHWVFLPFGPKDSNNQPTPPNNADFAIRAYGGKCGEIKINNLQNLRPKSWHWIKSNIDINLLISRFNNLDYSISNDTARQNSIGKGELVQLYTIFINSEL